MAYPRIVKRKEKMNHSSDTYATVSVTDYDVVDFIYNTVLTHKHVLLYGPSGCGKTEIIEKVRDRIKREAPNQFYRFINYVESFEESLKANAPAYISEETACERFVKIFKKATSILFVDNITATIAEDPTLSPLEHPFFALVSAADADALGLCGVEYVKIKVVSPDEKDCVRLLGNGLSEETAKELYKMTKGHPMALKIIDGLIRGERRSGDVLDRLRQRDFHLYSDDDGIMQVWMYEQFEKLVDIYLEDKGYDRDQEHVLRLLALLPFRMLPRSDIILIAGSDGDYGRVLDELADADLIRRHIRESSGERFYAAHTLISEAVKRKTIDIAEFSEYIYWLLNTLTDPIGCARCHYAWKTQPMKCAAEYFYCDHINTFLPDTPIRGALFACLGIIYVRRRDKQLSAKLWLARAWKLLNSWFDRHPDNSSRFYIAVTACALGETHYEMDEYRKAIEYQESALIFFNSIQAVNISNMRSELAKCRSALARAYAKCGMREKALKTQRDTIRSLEDAMDRDQLDLALAYKSYADILEGERDYRGAVSNQIKASRSMKSAIEQFDFKYGDVVKSRHYTPTVNTTKRELDFQSKALNGELSSIYKKLGELSRHTSDYSSAEYYMSMYPKIPQKIIHMKAET
jgi:tetratricopeptide (TPR) repeat protein